MRKKAEIIVFGQVQGVFFRAGVLAEARKLGLGGWTRNEPNGTVKILAQGEESDLQKLIDWCKIGIRFAPLEIRLRWWLNSFLSAISPAAIKPIISKFLVKSLTGFAKVEKVEVKWEDTENNFNKFEIKS